MAEMNHRVKNTFAMVQAMAAQSSRYAKTIVDFQASFASRLVVLAHSHDMLIKGGWEDAPLKEIIEGALGIYSTRPDCVTMAGPPVMLAANLVIGATLAFHELATNARQIWRAIRRRRSFAYRLAHQTNRQGRTSCRAALAGTWRP